MQKQDQAALYLIPVSIASFEAEFTIPRVVKNTIRKLDYYVVENERTARRFISSLQLGLDISQLQFRVLDKHTDPIKVGEMLVPLSAGKSIGVMSESGCPGVADPGILAVKYAHEHNFRVIPLPGPSSILMALMGSGLNGQQFRFHGYLPIKEKQLSQRIREIEKASQAANETQILIEAPYRNNRLLDIICNNCKPETMICVACNISGGDEFIRTKSIKNWRKIKPDLHKKPTVFLLYAGSSL